MSSNATGQASEQAIGVDWTLTRPGIAAVPSLRLFLNFFVGDRSVVPFVARTRKGVEKVLPVFHQTRLLSSMGRLYVVSDQKSAF